MTDSSVGEGDFTFTFAYSAADPYPWEGGDRLADAVLGRLGRHTWKATSGPGPGGPPVGTIPNSCLNVAMLHRAASDVRDWSRFTIRGVGGVLTLELCGPGDDVSSMTVRALTAEQAILAQRWDESEWRPYTPFDGAHYASIGDGALLTLILDVWESFGRPVLLVPFRLRDFTNAVLADAAAGVTLADLDPAVLTRLSVGWTGTPEDLLATARAITAPALI